MPLARIIVGTVAPTGGAGYNDLYVDIIGHNFYFYDGQWRLANGGGGGGSPGGADTEIQFNNSGSFGGIASATWDGNNLVLGGKDNSATPSGVGGNVTVKAGNGDPDDGTGGNVVIQPGSGDTPGTTVIKDGAGSTLLTLSGSTLVFAGIVEGNTFQTVDAAFAVSAGGMGLGATGVNSGSITLAGNTSGQSQIGVDANGNLAVLSSVQVFISNALAISGGLVAGDIYRTGLDPDTLCIVH